jgi:hypothetical protein
MTHDPNDIVRIYSGSMETVETYQQILKEVGIESRVVGESLTSVFGNAIPDTVELWVHQRDGEKAAAAIRMYEQEVQDEDEPHHPHPTDSPKPSSSPRHKEPYVNPNPSGD